MTVANTRSAGAWMVADRSTRNAAGFIAASTRTPITSRTTTPTASNDVHTLETEGVLREVTGRSWGRLYVADPILRIIDPPLS